MKILKFIPVAVLAAVSLFSLPNRTSRTAYAAEQDDCRALYLVDYDTGTVLKEKNATARYPIASMVKIMTLNLTFEEIEAGRLSPEEEIAVSDYAASMGGSQLFLDAGKKYPVSDLIKGVTVCSANDAAVALGERIAGSNEAFVGKMNAYAKSVGMNDTLYCNATGLPGGEQYSTAKDVTCVMRKLLSHPAYYDYAGIKIEDYRHPDGRITQLVNTNKLLRTYPECDAGKTGFTNEAMFCLSASAKTGDTRVIATVLGCPDSKTRFCTVGELFRTAFSQYETKVFLHCGEKLPCTATVKQAKAMPEELYCDRDLKCFVKKSDVRNYSLKIVWNENLSAPIRRGEALGQIVLTSDTGEELGSASLLTDVAIDKKTFWDRFKTVAEYGNIFRAARR